MHKLNVVLIAATALIFVTPSMALAGKKKTDTPKESVSLNYTKIKYEYTQRRANSSPGASAVKSGARR